MFLRLADIVKNIVLVKSTLIQDDGYLLMAISYVLGNPVRVGRVKDFLEYPWSSALAYFKKDDSDLIDNAFVEELYETAKKLHKHVRIWQERKAELPVIQSELGPLLADETGVGILKERFDRRSGKESS